jgi:hypothetical protein
MKTGLSLIDLATRITEQQAAKKDFIADSRELVMHSTDEGASGVALAVRGQGSFPMNGLAHDQVGQRTGVPSKYYDRMLNAGEEGRTLLASNVNHWFRANPEKRMIRTLGGNARAFLSNRYQRIDNEHVAEVALPVLQRIPDVKIVSAEITERRLYIQAVSPRVEGEVKRGDVIQAGVVISNSEVGCGSVSVASMDYRLICLNGMISTDKFRAFHVGRKVEDSEELWADDTRKADDRAVLLKVRDMVTAAVDAVRFRARIEKAQALAEGRIVGNPVEAVEVLSNRLGLNEGEKGGVLRSLIEAGDLTAWGMLNAVTHQAHSVTSYDRGVELQSMGGHLLNLDRKDWKVVLEAA